MSKKSGRRRTYTKRKQARQQARQIANRLPEEEVLLAFYEKREEIKEEGIRRIKGDLKTKGQKWRIVSPIDPTLTIRVKLNAAIIEDFCNWFAKRIDQSLLVRMLGPENRNFESFLAKQMIALNALPDLIEEAGSPAMAERTLVAFFYHRVETRALLADIKAAFMPNVVAELLLENPRYAPMLKPLQRKLAARAALYADFREATPDNYALFFPEARGLARHFILHLGPTNSGKTYDAIERLKAADRGVYLAPLRLLAYEQFERINADGVFCSMITGEERILVDGAYHQSSTIEMWNPQGEYDVAVIDEAQMIADPDRGSAWTNAILGVLAKEIHICASEDARDCLIRMILSCGDTYEIVLHERKTPLKMERGEFRFPNDVKEGDALIVFSRRDAHGVAADLKQAKIPCSIIYGALPYDVRHREAERFARGETKVVVATDAIGMGMNLPIRRVVFLQQLKFDGKTRRPLKETEIKQIAGRAGRFGIYDTGYVQSYGGRSEIKEGLQSELTPIEKAVIGIPADFFDREGNISDILSVWDELPATQDYDKGDIAEKIKIAQDLEKIAEEKDLVRQFIRFSVDRDDYEVYDLMLSYYRKLCKNETPELSAAFLRYDPNDLSARPEHTQALEVMYRVYDFLYAYTTAYGDAETLDTIMERKHIISDKLMEILESGYVGKRCKSCGRKLVWNYPYGLCESCYHRAERERRREGHTNGPHPSAPA